MSEYLSPYALLCACKPKPPATIVTPYDLYSTAQIQQESHSESAPPSSQHREELSERQYQRTPMTSVSKTHYIADIHTRHNLAARSTARTHPF